jgi:hypothetical protein
VIRRLGLVAAWLLVGHAALGGLYYALLQIPESTAWMLGLSALLLLSLVTGAAWVQAVGLLLCLPPSGWLATASAGVRRAWSVLPAFLLLAIAWVSASRLEAWHVASRGPIDASLMARFNWAETGGVHRAIDWAVFVLRFGIGGSLAAALAAAGVQHGFARAGRALGRALHPRTLAIVLGAELALVVLPWHYVYWRPASLPPTGVETAFVAAKLSAIALLAATGWAVVLWAGTRSASET